MTLPPEELDRLEALANAATKDGVIHRDNAFDIVRQTLFLIEEIRRLRGLNEWQPIETCPKDGSEFIILINHQERTKSFLKAGEEQEYRDLRLTYTAVWDSQFENIMVFKNPGAPYGYISLDPDQIDGWKDMPQPPQSIGEE